MVRDHRSVWARYRALFAGATVFFVAGICLCIYLQHREVRDHLVAKKSFHDAAYTGAQVWFASDSLLIAASQNGSTLTFRRWSPWEGWRTTPVSISIDANRTRWAVSPDGERIAWIRDNHLHSAAVDDTRSEPSLAHLDSAASTVALAVHGNSVYVVYNRSTIERRSFADLRVLGSQPLDLPVVDKVSVHGDYIAVTSTGHRRARLYRLLDDSNPALVEDRTTPDGAFDLVMPAPGQVAILLPAGVQYQGFTRNTFGAPRSLAVGHNHWLLAAGEFPGVLVNRRNGSPYTITDCETNSTIAASASYLACANQSGIALYRLEVEKRLTGRGQLFVYLGISLLSLTVLLLMLCLYSEFRILHLSKQAQQSAMDPLPRPPEDLVEALASGQAVLYAGDELSALSGFPRRREFIEYLIWSAAAESWLTVEQSQKLAALALRGKHEQALNQLVEDAKGSQPNLLLATYRTTFARMANLSPAHVALRELPWAAAITSNYDFLLEKTFEHLSFSAIPLKPSPSLYENGQLVRFFLLKLNGNPERPTTLNLCHDDLVQACEDCHDLTKAVNWLFRHRTLVFIGCSLETLVEELRFLQPPENPERRHFAVVSGKSKSWKKLAAQLEMRYGITSMVCDERHFADELPRFLEEVNHQLPRVAA